MAIARRFGALMAWAVLLAVPAAPARGAGPASRRAGLPGRGSPARRPAGWFLAHRPMGTQH